MNTYGGLSKQELTLLPHRLSSFQASEFFVPIIVFHFPVFWQFLGLHATPHNAFLTHLGVLVTSKLINSQRTKIHHKQSNKKLQNKKQDL